LTASNSQRVASGSRPDFKSGAVNPIIAMACDGYQDVGPRVGFNTDLSLTSYLPPLRFDPSNGKLFWGGNWVAFRRGAYLPALSLGPPNYIYSGIRCADYLTPEEKAEFTRFLLTLELWERTPGTKEVSAKEVWHNSLLSGPEYVDILDDQFALGWRYGNPDSYNFVFPSKLLPRFEEETNDLDLSLDPTWSDPDTLDSFEFELSNLLSEIDASQIRLPTDQEIVFERSTTTSYVHSLKRTMPQWEASLTCNRFEDKKLYGLRCKVPVYPGGTRDTIIADISANYSIRWIERTMRHILEYVPESADCLYSSTFEKRKNSVVFQKGYHVLRDIKKCGITYNTRDLFPILKRNLNKLIPDIRWNRYDIYSNLIYVDESGEHRALRGYGLGMANHSVTLCNIVISRMALRATSQHLGREIKAKSITGNDDQDTVFPGLTKDSKKAAEAYLQSEHDIHGHLGNWTNHKKSVVVDFGLFYEEYSKDGFKYKESLACNALACAYLAPSIRIAKHYIASQSERFSNSWGYHELKCLANFWGGEFFSPDIEMKINCEVGGWLNTTSLGLKTTLRDLDQLYEYADGALRSMIPFAYETCKLFFEPPLPKWRTHEIVDNFLYKGPSKPSEKRVQLYTLGDNDLRSYYKELTTFERNYDKRLSNTSLILKNRRMKTKREIFDSLLKTNPFYSIPYSMVGYESHTKTGYRYGLESELRRYDDDPIRILLSGGELYSEDEIFVWDPPVHSSIDPETYIETSSWQQMTASVFSNSGFIPTLEYFWRNETYPVCDISLGRVREPVAEDIVKGERAGQVPGPNAYIKKYTPFQLDVEDEEIEPEPPPVSFEEELAEAKKRVFGEQDGINPITGERVATSAFELEFGSTKYDHVNRDESYGINLSDGSDDDALGFDLDAW